MARSSACYSPCQNLYNSKNKLAGRTPTEGCDRRTPALTATCAPTPAALSVVALFAASGFANSSVVRYSEDDLQQIFRAVLDSRPSAPVLALVVAAAPYSEGPRERPLKAWFPDIYRGKTHLECYNFFQQCKDHFAIAGTTGPNRVSICGYLLKKYRSVLMAAIPA